MRPFLPTAATRCPVSTARGPRAAPSFYERARRAAMVLFWRHAGALRKLATPGLAPDLKRSARQIRGGHPAHSGSGERGRFPFGAKTLRISCGCRGGNATCKPRSSVSDRRTKSTAFCKTRSLTRIVLPIETGNSHANFAASRHGALGYGDSAVKRPCSDETILARPRIERRHYPLVSCIDLPVARGNIAVGINYADHIKEMRGPARTPSLVQAPTSLLPHCARSRSFPEHQLSSRRTGHRDRTRAKMSR